MHLIPLSSTIQIVREPRTRQLGKGATSGKTDVVRAIWRDSLRRLGLVQPKEPYSHSSKKRLCLSRCLNIRRVIQCTRTDVGTCTPILPWKLAQYAGDWTIETLAVGAVGVSLIVTKCSRHLSLINHLKW